MMGPLPVPVEWGFLLVLSVAVGADLYLTLLALTLVPRVLAGFDPPGRLGFLSGAWVAVPSALMYVLGWSVGTSGRRVLLWDAFHLPVKMAAGGGLALLLFPGRTGWALWGAAALGAAVAGAVHGLRVGWRIILDHGSGKGARWLRATAEDALAVVLVWVTHSVGAGTGLVAAGTVLLVLLLTAGPGVRAALFVRHLLRGVARHALGFSDLRPAERLPGWIRRAVNERAGREVSGLRGTRAALAGASDGGPFRTGWFVPGPDGPVFLYRASGRIRAVELSGRGPTEPRAHGELIRVAWPDRNDRLALLLPLGARLEELRTALLPVAGT